MTSPHLSDTEIQQYVLHRDDCPAGLLQHMDACAACQVRATNYGMLFTALEKMPIPSATEVDVAAILATLPVRQKNRREPSLIYLPILAGMVFLGVCWMFRKLFFNVFADTPAFSIYIILGATLFFALIRALGLIRQYRRRMHSIDFS